MESIQRPVNFITCAVIAFLILPMVVTPRGGQSRAQVYRTVPDSAGPFPAIERQIFQENGDIDVLFLGDSILWAAVDVTLFKEGLSRSLGREAVVLSFASNWDGIDRHYVLLKDLLARRRVGMVVFNLPSPKKIADKPHVQSFRWLRFAEFPELFDGLSWGNRLSLYSVMVLGAPRQLLGRLRGDLVDPNSTREELLEGLNGKRGYLGEPFVDLGIETGGIKAEPVQYSGATKNQFSFTGPALGPMQRHFANLLVNLLTTHSVKGVVLHVPRYAELGSHTVDERECWPDALGGNLSLVGLSSKELFGDMDESKVRQFYYDDHLNKNGKFAYTRAVSPKLWSLYGEAKH